MKEELQVTVEKLNCLPLQAEYDLASNELWVEGARAGVQVRTVKEMTDVLYDRMFASKANPADGLYYMFRGACRKEDAALFEENKIRYDVTSMPARQLGREFVKTFGHYHPLAPGSKHAFPELYEVLHGEAWYVLQKRKEKDGKNEIEEIIVVEAHAGDKVLMPPDYGHLTINPSSTETLVMANLVEAGFKSNYEPFKQKAGAAYYALADGEWVNNPNYDQPPVLKKTTAPEFWGNKPLHKFKENAYAEFLKSPESFSFLRKPDELF